MFEQSGSLIAQRYALAGFPYTIHFFLGKVDDEWFTSQARSPAAHPDHIGSVYTFSFGGTTDGLANCPNCSEQETARALSTAQVPLTISLYRHAQNNDIPDFNTIDWATAVPCIAENLTWKAVSVGLFHHFVATEHPPANDLIRSPVSCSIQVNCPELEFLCSKVLDCTTPSLKTYLNTRTTNPSLRRPRVNLSVLQSMITVTQPKACKVLLNSDANRKDDCDHVVALCLMM